ncbi:hypothetical protein TREES_T100003908 [Tupaia chinensis]|uniref:Uncharacterized protein n=1 Tax=Tupaia chinensis TaxID=246437 RepID=L9KZI6_TUPCH|nr:hypothetical protein TREES_T100003908 [Tupaia chinensis]
MGSAASVSHPQQAIALAQCGCSASRWETAPSFRDLRRRYTRSYTCEWTGCRGLTGFQSSLDSAVTSLRGSPCGQRPSSKPHRPAEHAPPDSRQAGTGRVHGPPKTRIAVAGAWEDVTVPTGTGDHSADGRAQSGGSEPRLRGDPLLRSWSGPRMAAGSTPWKVMQREPARAIREGPTAGRSPRGAVLPGQQQEGGAELPRV